MKNFKTPPAPFRVDVIYAWSQTLSVESFNFKRFYPESAAIFLDKSFYQFYHTNFIYLNFF